MSTVGLKDARQLLRSQGKRVTRQRRLLIEIMQERGRHLDADELYILARKREPRISLSTVQRTLSLLKELRSKEVRRLLRSQGKRVTPQRVLLLDILQERGGHLDADELYLLAKKREPRLSLSTVYRTLSLLKELDLIEELHFDEEHHHYEIKGRGAEHYHLICLDCGEIIEFESPLTDRVKAQIAQEHHFQVTGAHIDLKGYCQRCVEGLTK